MSIHNKSIARRLYQEGLNARKLHVLDEICADNFVDHNPEPGQAPGREGVKAMFRQFFDAFPDMVMRVDSLVAEGDLVGAHVTVTGTHLGAFAGIPATGRTVTVTGFDWVRIQNGKVVERRGVFDQLGMMAQLGAVPGPSAVDLKAMSRRYYDMLDKGRGDLAAIKNELFHPMHTTYFCGQGPIDPSGLQMLAQQFWAAFPDLTHTIAEQICEGDTVVNRLTARGTHNGDFAGVKPTQRTVEVMAVTSHRYADGRLLEQRVEVDMVGVLQQIGAIPSSS